MAMYGNVWLNMTIYDYKWLCMTMHDHVWLCLTMYDYVRPRVIIYYIERVASTVCACIPVS